MDCQIVHNGTDITDHVISYERAQHICTGIGEFSVTLLIAGGHSYELWDEVVLYEGGRKKGTYNISSVDRKEDGSGTLNCQDDSLKLQSYFIADQWEEGGLTNARYWIERILTDAKVNYTFTVDDVGSPVAPMTPIGLTSAFDAITSFLQQSGWYMYFNNNSRCIIGKLKNKVSNPRATYNDQNIINISTNMNDTALRNRAVVWGASDPTTQAWVYADLSRHTPWNYDSADKRTIAMGNSMVRTTAIAKDLATKMLNEFARATFIKVIDVAGESNVVLGNSVKVKSRFFSGSGIITTLGSSMSAQQGLVTKVTLDERCPRLFAYYSWYDATDSDYVYVGTWGSGVWRKPIEENGWEDYSTGLVGLNVGDLHISNGVFACISSSALYVRLVDDASWTPILPGDFMDWDTNTPVLAADVEAQCVTIDRLTGVVYAGYRSTVDTKAWIVQVLPDFTISTKAQIWMLEGETYDLFLGDIDHDSKDLWITAATTRLSMTSEVLPCGDQFTSHDQNTVSKSWTGGVSSGYTKPVICDGVVYQFTRDSISDEIGWIWIMDTKLSVDPFIDLRKIGPVSITANSRPFLGALNGSSTTFYFSTIRFPPVYDSANPEQWIARWRVDVASGVVTYLGEQHIQANIGALTFKNISWGYKRVGTGVTFNYYDLFSGNFSAVTADFPDIDEFPVIRWGNQVCLAQAYNTVGIATYLDARISNKSGGSACDDWWTGCFCGEEDVTSILHHYYVVSASLDILSLSAQMNSMEVAISTGSDSSFIISESYAVGSCATVDGKIYGLVGLKAYDRGPWIGRVGSPPCVRQYPDIPNYLTAGGLIELGGGGGLSSGYNPDLITYVHSDFPRTLYTSGGVFIPGLPITGGTAILNAGGGVVCTITGNLLLKMDYLTGKFYTIVSRTVGFGKHFFLRRWDQNGGLEAEILISKSSLTYTDSIYDHNANENIIWVDRHAWGGAQYADSYIDKTDFIKFGDQLTMQTSYDTAFFVASGIATPASGVTLSGGVFSATGGVGVFQTMDRTLAIHRLEASQSFPISTYHPTADQQAEIDALRLGGVTDGFYGVTDNAMVPYNVNDARIFDVGEFITVASGTPNVNEQTPQESYTVPSGYNQLTTSGIRQIGIASQNAFLFTDVDLTQEWSTLATFPGNVGHIETSNFLDPQLFFVSISGAVTSGVVTSGVAASGVFYQNTAVTSGIFADFSLGLPGSQITVIRLDDLI